MASSTLFPKEIIEWTSEYYVSSISKHSRLIYIAILTSLMVAIGILPFVSVNVSIKSAGLLHAASEINNIKASFSGIVKSVTIHENSIVKKGDLLFTIQSPVLAEKVTHLKSTIQENAHFIDDLQNLSLPHVETNYMPRLQTSLYQQAWMDFSQKLKERQNRFSKVDRDYLRNKKLFDEQVISTAEFENYEFERSKAITEKDMLVESQLGIWQQDLLKFQRENKGLKNDLAISLREKENLSIYAPVSGSIQNLSGIYPGSTVFVNEDLAQISPDTTLLAEVYVSPNDIGLLKIGMNVLMQINAFHYHQWGLLPGNISEISGDILIKNDQPYFKVKCRLSQDHLSLKNGYKGKLKKGMSLTSRFLISERTLWQLLYDKIDSWINPNVRPTPN